MILYVIGVWNIIFINYNSCNEPVLNKWLAKITSVPEHNLPQIKHKSMALDCSLTVRVSQMSQSVFIQLGLDQFMFSHTKNQMISNPSTAKFWVIWLSNFRLKRRSSIANIAFLSRWVMKNKCQRHYFFFYEEIEWLSGNNIFSSVKNRILIHSLRLKKSCDFSGSEFSIL